MQHSIRKNLFAGRRFNHRLCLPLLLSMAGAFATANADPVISFSVLNPTIIAGSGDTVTFVGTITNDSGQDLSASDFFFNFFGFDPTAVTPVQDLGLITDFVIPNTTASAAVDLFDVQISPGVAPGSSFPISIQVEDILGDFSTIDSVTVSIPNTTGVPEPASWLVWGPLGIAAFLLSLRSRRHQPASRLLAVLLAVSAGGASLQAQTPGPVFSTRLAISGVVNNSTFTVFLPLFNSGAAPATNVQIVAASLGVLAPASPSFPLTFATLAPSDYQLLDLQFNSGSLIVGRRYLLTVRGTYQATAGGATLGFAVNQIVVPSIPTSDAATQLQYFMALDALKDQISSLPGVDPAADRQTILAYFQSQPQFVDAGIDQASSTVWATFIHGEEIAFVNNRPTSQAPAASPTAASLARSESFTRPRAASMVPLAAPVFGPFDLPVELPASSAVRLLNTLPSPQFQGDAVVANLADLLRPQNYTFSAPAATVSNLKAISGDGVFYYSSHGFLVGDGTVLSPLRFGLWTTTKSNAFEATLLPLLDWWDGSPGILPYLVSACDDQVPGQPPDCHFSITASFVRNYFGTFGGNSLVYIDACNSDDSRTGPDSAQDFKAALFSKGASVYAGWSASPGDPDAANSARLVFDRLLGANIYFPETLPTASGQVFNQRPFSWPYLVYPSGTLPSGDIAQHNLGVSGAATLRFTINTDAVTNSQTVFGLLAPSLAAVDIQEAGSFPGQTQSRLFLLGNSILGSDPGSAGSITIGGSPVTVIPPWSTHGFPTLLPSNGVGAGDGGDVIVTVRNHHSNPVRVTLWQGTFNYVANGRDSLTLKATFHLAFRADIRQFRQTIHVPPQEPVFISAPFSTNPGSTASFSCSGTSTVFPPDTDNASDEYTWTGLGAATLFLTGNPPPPPPPYFSLTGSSQNHTSLNLQIPLDADLQCNRHLHSVFPSPPGGTSDSDNPMLFAYPSFPSLSLTLSDPDAVIQSDVAQFPSQSCNGAGPPPNMCPGSIQWNSITPDGGTAPDPNSPR